ncbi:Kelch motif family protein [Pseudoalteromonas phage J2-1_QLiu-2017]|nr:Kelch motif family protein [Pseudoalteromonas phage J2-1_QLiu-2017]
MSNKIADVFVDLEAGVELSVSDFVTVSPEEQKDTNIIAEFTRASTAYDSAKNLLSVNQPAQEAFQISTHRFVDIPNIYPVTPLDPNVVPESYTDALATIKQIAVDYPEWTYHNLADHEPLASGREQPALSYALDSGKPTFIMQIATHGNEKHSLLGVLEFIKVLMTSSAQEMVWARNNLCFMINCIHNVDGWALDRRRNGTDTSSVYTGINLNRNWDYFWDYAADPDKGDQPFAVPENRNFKHWLETNDRVGEGVLFFDYHSWRSRSIYGFLTDHIFPHGLEGQTLQRNLWRQANELVARRDFTGYTLNGGPSNMVFSERTSTRKPYAPYWAAQRMEKRKGFACQWEVPEGDESQAVNAMVIMDTVHAGILAAKDHLTTRRQGFLIDKGVDASAILNQNSNIQDWSTSQGRPLWMRFEGLVLVNNNGSADMFRPKSSAWPRQSAEMAYATYTDEVNPLNSFFIVMGGRSNNDGETGFCYAEPIQPPEPPPIGSNQYGIYKPERAQTTIDRLPEPTKAGAAVICNGYVYHLYGHTGTYNTDIQRLRIPTPAEGVAMVDALKLETWESVPTTGVAQNPVQRHSAIVRGTDIYIIGGRDGSDYLRDVHRLDTTTNELSLCTGQIPYKNGYFGIIEHPTKADTWFYFGGWNGVATKNDFFELVIDPTTHEVSTSRLADLPVALRGMGYFFNDDKTELNLLGGETASNVFTDNLHIYDIANDTWRTESPSPEEGAADSYFYSNALSDDEDPFDVASMKVSRGAMGYNNHELKFWYVGGERQYEDLTVDATDTFFEMDMSNKELSARVVNDVTYGTFRTSSSQPLNDPASPCTVVSTVQNKMEWTNEDEKKINPYVRTLCYLGNDFASTERWRHKYFVPPRNKKVSMPIYGPSSSQSATRCYAYMRLYGEGTKITHEGLQMIEGKILTPRMIPDAGIASERLRYRIGKDVEEVVGAYHSPLNERFDMELPIAEFKLKSKADDSDLANTVRLVHKFDKTAGTGMIVARQWDGSNVVKDLDILNFIPNYDLYTNMYKRDVVNFKFNREDNTITIWVYGTNYTTTIDWATAGEYYVHEVVAHYEEDAVAGLGFWLEGVTSTTDNLGS